MKLTELLAGPKKLWAYLGKYRLVLLVLAAGLALLLWPQGGETEEESSAPQTDAFDLAGLEERLGSALSRIEGAGEVLVVLTLRSGGENVYAVDVEYSRDGEAVEERVTTVLTSAGSGVEEPALVSRREPVFQGALVVCGGGDDPEVRLLITQAVASLTGLGMDKITVCKSYQE